MAIDRVLVLLHSLFSRCPSRNSHFSTLYDIVVTMIMFWVYHNARTMQNSDIKFIAKAVDLQSRKIKSLFRTEMRLLYSRYRTNHQKFIS